MTTQEGGCLFQIGYWFYTRTCLGYIYHRRDVNKAREKYGEGESHSVIQTKTYNDLKITPVPMSLDNLAYVITDGKTTVVIDPGDPEPVNEYLEKNNIIPDAVLVTHKHWSCDKRQEINIPTFPMPSEEIPRGFLLFEENDEF
ncbi:Hypothetical predicted protein, partial [Mytilus galloprovincialis]